MSKNTTNIYHTQERENRPDLKEGTILRKTTYHNPHYIIILNKANKDTYNCAFADHQANVVFHTVSKYNLYNDLDNEQYEIIPCDLYVLLLNTIGDE